MKSLILVLSLCVPSICLADESDDFFLSVPAQGAIMRVDNVTAQASVYASGVLIPHYGWFLDGNLYMPDRGWPALLKIAPDGSVTPITAGGMLHKPVTALPAPAGDGILLSDTEPAAIFHIGFDGTQTLLHDTLSSNGLLTGPDGMAFDQAGNLYVANLVGDTIIKFDPQGNASLFSASPLISQPGALVIDGSGNLFAAMYGASTIVRFRLDTGEAELFAADIAKMISPSDMKLSRDGGLIASTRNSNIIRVDAKGQIDVLFHDATFGDIVGLSVPQDNVFCTGTFTSFGTGKAGSGGITPQLRAIYSPCPGQQIGLELKDFLGGSLAYMLLDVTQGSLPFLGSTLLLGVSPFFTVVPLPMPGAGPGNGDLTLQFNVPNDPNIVGLHLYYQALGADPGATFGVSFTNGLHEVIGN